MDDQLKRLEQGIRIAHEKGDADVVRKLGAEYRRLQQNAPQPQATAEPAQNQGFLDALVYGTDVAGKNIGQGILSLGELTGSETLQQFGREKVAGNEADMARRNYSRPENLDGFTKNIREGDFGEAFQSLGHQVAEGAPSVGGGLVASGAAAAATVASAPIAATAATATAIGATGLGIIQALGENRSEKEEQGLDPTATYTDLGSAIASGIIELVPAGRGGGAIIRFTKEGLQEVGQEGLVIGNTAIQGGEYVADDVVNRLTDAGVVGGIVSKGGAVTSDAVYRGTAGTINATKNGIKKGASLVGRVDYQDYKPSEIAAAERIERAAGGDPSILGNVDDTGEGTAKGAAMAALKEARAEVKGLAAGLRKLAKYNDDPQAAERLNTIVDQAGNQNTPTPDDHISRVRESFGNEPDILRLIETVEEINTIQKFTKGGTEDVGGISQYTRLMDLFDKRNTIKAFTMGGVGLGAVSNLPSAALAVGGGTAINRGARLIDKLTNRRSKVKRFVDSAKKSDNRPAEIVGPRAEETVKGLKQRDAIQKAVSKLQMDAAKAKTDGKLTSQNKAALDQSKAETVAQRYKLNAANNAAMFESGKAPQNQDPMYAPYRLWEARIGRTGDDVVSALEAMERDGLAPQGAAQKYSEDIGWFAKNMDRNDLISMQEQVRQRINPEHNPDFSHLDKHGNTRRVNPEDVLKKFQATDTKPSASRRKEKALEGGRRSRNLTAEIESAEGALNADQYTTLLDLKETIDSPSMTRAERFDLVNSLIPEIFSKPEQAAMVELWKKKFAPLAAIGNDYAIRREEAETDPVQAEKEETFEQKKRDAKKPRKVRTKKAANDNRKPAVDRPVETTADKALRKLKKPRKEASEPDTAATKAREAEAPTRGRKVRQNLRQRVEDKKQDIYDTIELAANGHEELDTYIQSLNAQKSTESRVEQLIYQFASDRVTENQLVEAFANAQGIPAVHAAEIVNNALASMEQRGMLKRRLVRNNARLKFDGKFVKDEDGQGLLTVDLEFTDPELAQRVQTAKAVRQIDRMVPQGDPEVEFGPQTLTDGAFKALKDIPAERVDQSFKPIFDFLNSMRSNRLSVSPTMMKQIDEGLAKAGTKNVGTINDVLNPKDSMGRPDDAPIRTVAHLKFQAEESGSSLLRQEWMAGDNLRVYSKNGLAHTQAGDIMKGLLRAPEKVSVAGEAGLNYVFHGIGNLLGFDKASPKDRREAIFQGDMIDQLIKFSEDPFGRTRLKKSNGEQTEVGNIVADGEGFFQALNAANEVNNMVQWARARHKDKSNLVNADLLSDPEVRSDMAQNYETDFIVQLDASNNAYQIAGMVMGYQDVLKATGLMPQSDNANPDETKGDDIYVKVAAPIATRIPELQTLDLPQSKLRKVFKKPVGTYLYAAEFNSRKDAFQSVLEDIAGDAPVFGVEEQGLIPVSEDLIADMRSPEGFRFVTPKFDVDGVPKAPNIARKRVVKDGDKFIVETAKGDRGDFQRAGRRFDSEADAIRSTYSNNLYARMSSELVREMNTQFPGMTQYLGFARQVSEIVKGRGQEEVKVPTKDGMMLEYSFKKNPEFARADVPLGDGNVIPLGVRTPSYKLAGRGLAAFMTHQNDAWALRETHRRLNEDGGLIAFNPIHDSYGFHPADAQRGQETWVQVMQELGAEDYNIFLDILAANQISVEEFKASFTNPTEAASVMQLILGRQGVPQVSPDQIPTALS